MKLYISCDMEGTAAVCSWMQCDPSNTREYPVYRRYMSQEVRAAIDGARSAGVTGVLVNDSHWDMRNLLWDELPADVRVISGSRKPFSMTQGLDRDYAGAFFTGYHAKVGDADGVLAHTYTADVLYNVRINGTACSEALLNAAMAGYYGIPLLLVSGDRVVVEHVKEFIPQVTGVVVKDGIGHYSAASMTPRAAQDLLRDAAARAIREAAASKPFTFDSPVVMELDTARVEQADFIELMPGFERTGGRTVRFADDDYLTVFRAFVAAFRLGGAATAPA
ncbi:MAG TPA: M55 family metallopeptidase [Candidatus Baltobacteraceae bacterium]|jgi:D-amino peptidase|nr:M55 family metallopeptidase [Candidatus Baltobacteraceae bacterium]